jgi:hypothetical protein
VTWHTSVPPVAQQPRKSTLNLGHPHRFMCIYIFRGPPIYKRMSMSLDNSLSVELAHLVIKLQFTVLPCHLP